MEDDNLKAFKKRMVLQYFLSQLFDNSNDLAERLSKLDDEKKQSDPFIEIPEVREEPKPLKFLLNNDGQRFKALKNKALSKEKEQSAQVEGANAETGQSE